MVFCVSCVNLTLLAVHLHVCDWIVIRVWVELTLRRIFSCLWVEFCAFSSVFCLSVRRFSAFASVFCVFVHRFASGNVFQRVWIVSALLAVYLACARVDLTLMLLYFVCLSVDPTLPRKSWKCRWYFKQRVLDSRSDCNAFVSEFGAHNTGMNTSKVDYWICRVLE